MAYNTTHNLWKNLGEDAYTKVRSEVVGTGDGSTSIFELDHDNNISGSNTIYTDGSSISSSDYSLDLDDGTLTFVSAPNSGSVITSDYDYADATDSWMTELLNQANEELTNSTGRTFDQTTNSTEYIDVRSKQTIFYTKNYPVINLTTTTNTTSDLTSPAGWYSVSEGIGNDYLLDEEYGKIEFIDNKPLSGRNRVKVVYDYGFATTPSLAKELELLMATRKLVNSSIYKSIVKGRDNFTPVRLDEIENRIAELTKMLGKQNISSI